MNFECWATGTWAEDSWVVGSWCPGPEPDQGGGIPAWWMAGRLPPSDDDDVLIAWFILEEM
jgi:hypothetical protein